MTFEHDSVNVLNFGTNPVFETVNSWQDGWRSYAHLEWFQVLVFQVSTSKHKAHSKKKKNQNLDTLLY